MLDTGTKYVTKEAFKDPHKETVGWENFLGMTIGQAVVWASWIWHKLKMCLLSLELLCKAKM